MVVSLFPYFPVPASWRHISPGCVRAHNIIRYHKKTVDECKKLCDEKPECKAIEYGVPHGGSRIHYEAGDCQLNRGVNPEGCDGKHENLDLYIKPGKDNYILLRI